MKTNVCRLTLILIFLSVSAMGQDIVKDDIVFTPIEHASMVIQIKEKTVYIDPVGDLKMYKSLLRPDLILITHLHHDHLDPSVIAAVKTTKTVVIGPPNVIQQLEFGKALGNGEKTTVGDVQIEAIPAHNLTPERMKFHPKGRDNGYVLTLNKKRIYISGDTEDIKEMRALKNIDYAFICMNLPYTMTVEQAASAVLEMEPGVVIPYHYRGTNGMSDLKAFKRLVGKNKDIEVRLLDWYGKKTLIKGE